MLDEHVSEVTVPAIGLGTMRQQGDACRDLVEAALAEGYRHLDTARKYGNEEAVGAGVRRSSVPRDEILVTTKLQIDDLDPTNVKEATVDSLGRLGLDHVDLLLIHWPSPTIPAEDTLEAMQQVRGEGLTRFIGVANFPSTLLERVAATPGLVCNQVEYHPYLSQEPVLSVVRDRGLVLTAYCPLGRGGPLLEDGALRGIADDCGRTVPQVILRWLVQQERVVAIPGTASLEHLRENLAVHDFALDREQVAVIDALARGDRVVDPPHAPEWD